MQKPFQTNPWELGHLLDSIDKGQIVVPEFQRSFVWDPGDTFDLIVSIANSYPAGSLLFVRQRREHVLESRPIEGVDTDPKQRLEADQLVLDGQQRLTSLYQALYGKGKHRFFIDLEELVNGGELEDALVYEKAERAKKYEGSERQFTDRHLPLTSVFGRESNFDKWMFDFIEYRVDNYGEDRKELQTWLTGIKNRYLLPIQRYEFPVIELNEATSLEAIVRIFETLNLKGVKLTVFEILTAKLYSSLKLRDLWKKARESDPTLAQFVDDDESAYVLKTVALLRYKDNKSQALSCKRSALLELEAKDVQQHWDEAIKSLNDALILLKNEHGVLSKKWLPYVTILPPFAALLRIAEAYSPGPLEGEARSKVLRWFWASVFSQRYDSGTDTKSVTDMLEVIRWTEGEGEPSVVRAFRLDMNDLKTVSEQRNAIYRGIICLAVRNGALDFHNMNRISTLNLQKDGIEDHHVFPYQYLLDRGVRGDIKNSILNKTLIDASTNSSIGKNAPSVYLEGIQDDKRSVILKSHLLIKDDSSPLFKDDFGRFLVEREDLLGELIAGLTGTKYDPSTKVVSSPNYALEAAKEGQEEEQQRGVSIDITSQLSKLTGEEFHREGSSSIYKSSTRTFVGRWSRLYGSREGYYWYALTPKDLASIVSNNVSGFAYVCSDAGVVIVPSDVMQKRVEAAKLNGTFRDGELHHYHIQFRQTSGGLEWIQKDGATENVQQFYLGNKPQERQTYLE